MQAYGAVAPGGAPGAVRAAAQRESKSNGNTFMGIIAAVLVLALVVGHQAPAAAHTSGLAAAGPAMHDAPAAAQMNPEAKQMAVAAMQKQLAVAKEAAVAPVKKASALDEEAPEEEDAPKESAVEQGEDAVEGLLPPVKSGIKGGEGKILTKSVEDAMEDMPNSKNSHYIKDHTDKEVHLLIIFFMLLGTILVYYMWKSKEDRGVAMTPTRSKATGV